MKKLLLFLSILCSFLMNAQGENNNWYFGPGVGLNFATNPPSLLSGGAVNTMEGVATISSPEGQLLFYTDGVTVWNRQHTAMVNGTGLGGHDNSQQVVIVPYPGNNNKYYVFTCPPVGTGLGANPTITYSAYTMVDMSLGAIGTNGFPLGDVITTEKNIELHDQNGNSFAFLSESIGATQHADNKGYWIVFANGSNLYSYKLDADGFHVVPVVSSLPEPVAPVAWHMHLRISPRFEGLAYSNLISLSRWPGGLYSPNPNYGVRVFSFDDATGLITSDYLTTIGPNPIIASYATEFSPNGQLLYTSAFLSQATYVFDLFNGDFRVLYNGNNNTTAGSVQRAVNGEIYLAFQVTNSTTIGYEHLAKINNPDSYAGCSLQRDGLFIGTHLMGDYNYGSLGLPPLVPVLSSSQDACYEHLVFGLPETNNIVRQAGSSITTNNFYKVGNGLNVSLKAGDFVLLSSGSYIEPGSNFVAKIDGCESVGLKKAKVKSDPVRFVIDVVESVNEIVAYPNPATDKVNLAIKGGIMKSIEVYTIDGRNIVVLSPDAAEYQLDISRYQKGMYMLSVTTDDDKVHSVKIVKQ